MAVTAGTPEAQAAQLADALAKPDQRLAAWLGVYKALGIPVIDENGNAVSGTGDDPVGPPYWMVWNAAATDTSGAGITLADAGRTMTALPDGSTVENAGTVLLADLRAATASSDPNISLLGFLARERILRGPSKQDLLSPEATPDTLIIDPATIQLLQWVAVRGAASRMAGSSTTGSTGQLVTHFATSRMVKAPAGANCSEMFGDEDVTFWINFIANKGLGGGLGLIGGKGLPGMVEIIMTHGFGASEGAVEGVSKFTGGINAVGALLSFEMMMKAITVEGDMNGPLERTKKSDKNGKENTITWKLYFDKEKGADGNDAWACAANFISNAFGVNFTPPQDGPIEGAELTFNPGKNIPEKVLFNTSNPNQKVTTQAGGVATLPMIGKAQKKDLPEDSKKYDDTFTVEVEAQPEAANGNSIVNMFFDSYAFWSSESVPTAIAPLVDLLKTMHWSLGEHEFLLIDWKQKGYKVDSSGGDWTFNGIICDTSKPFTIKGTAPQSFQTMEFEPLKENKGNVKITGIIGSETIYSGTALYVIEGLDEGKPKLRIVHNVTGTLPEASSTDSKNDSFDLIPLDTDECKE